MARRSLAFPPTTIDRWCQYVQDDVNHIAEATGFVNFELSYDGQQQRRVISPKHYIITFSSKDKGRPRYHSSLLTLRLVPEESLPEQVQVGVEVRGRGGESVVCAGEYVEFELLSLVNDASKQPPLRIASGPVRLNPETQQREFMRIDLGRCVRQIITDIIDDPKHKGQKLVRSRWWICVEVLRLVCSANSLDCSALDTASAVPLEWVICLTDEKGPNGGSSGQSAAGDAIGQEEKSIDELAKFIDGGAKRGKARQRRKKKGEESPEDGQDTEQGRAQAASAMGTQVQSSSRSSSGQNATGQAAPPPSRGAPSSSKSETPATAAPQAARATSSTTPARPTPPPGWSRTVDLAPALVDIWQDSAGCDVRHIAESTGFVHFLVSFNPEKRRRVVSPASYVIAFPHVAAGQQRYHSALLKLGVALDVEIPDAMEGTAATSSQLGRSTTLLASDQGRAENISFELLAREGEAPVQTPLHFTTGPVRINEKTGQRESMRLDMAECVRWAPPDLVEGVLNGAAQRLVRQRWWLGIGALRLICSVNGLDSSGLDLPGTSPLEWVACLVDEKLPTNSSVIHPPESPPTSSVLEQELKRLMENLPTGVDSTPSAAPKPKAKKKAKEEDPVRPSPAPASHSSPTPPAAAAKDSDAPQRADTPQPAEPPKQPSGKTVPPSRTLALPSTLIDSWCQFARKNITHVAEATGFVHFELSFDADLHCRVVSPEHYIIAFPNRDKGRQRYNSSLLTMRIVKESEVPEDYVIQQLPSDSAAGEEDSDCVEFELLLRVHEAPVQQQLRITAGPVRTNSETGQRESMRIDLGRCVRQILTEVVDDPRGKRVVRNRWWICVETLRLVCTANALDCSALDEPGKPPVEWVICLVDERSLRTHEALPRQEEERNIDDLVSFIAGKAGNAKKKKKKKDKDRGPAEEATEPTLHPTALGSQCQQLQLQAAVRLLTEAAASCTTPQQAAVAAAATAAAEAARKAAEAATAGPGPDAAAGQPLFVPSPCAAPGQQVAALPRTLQQAQQQPWQQPPQQQQSVAATRPLLGGWEPTPLPSSAEATPLANGLSGSASVRLEEDPTSRAFGGLAELESLVAGLRSEFAEGRGLPKREGRSIADLLLQRGGIP